MTSVDVDRPPPSRGWLRHRAAGLVAAGLAAAAAAPATAQEMGPLPTAFRFADYRATVDELDDPARVLVGRDDLIYVAEAGRSRIRVFTSAGEPVRSFGGPGDEPGELLAPRGLAQGPDGALYVADTGNHRVQVLDESGAPIGTWGAYGPGDGQFNEPRGIAVDDARVYVADLGNSRVQVFDHEGTLLLAFGTHGDGDGEFNRPVDVAVDGDGFIYVADADNNRIQKFDPAGVFIKSWGDYGPYSGLMDEPGGLVLRDGQLYVADTRNHRLQIFDREGELLFQWGRHAQRSHEGEGLLHYPNDLAIAPSGAFGVLCEGFENRLQIFEAAAPGEEPAAARPMAARMKQTHFGDHLDVEGRLLAIAEPESHRLVLFETSKDVPIVIGMFGERGTRFGQMIRPAGLALDVPGRLLYVSDLATRRVQTFALDYDPEDARRYALDRAKFSQAFDLARLHESLRRSDMPWVIEPTAIARDESGSLYVVDARNSLVLVFDPKLRFIRAWGGYGTEPGRFRRPTDIAFGRDGETVYVVDADNHRVQAFDLEGEPRFAWGTAGGGDGELRRAFGIAAGRDGFVYLTDSSRHDVQKFTEDGTFVTSWGGLGTEHGRFWKPRGIVQDDRGRLIVIDRGNHRAQIFSPEGAWLVSFGTGRAYTPKDLERQRRREEAGQ